MNYSTQRIREPPDFGVSSLNLGPVTNEGFFF
jgi:hypothetical protein